MKVLVTGATGFIGTHVINELIHLGHSVIATSADLRKAKSKSWFDHVDYLQYNLVGQDETNLFKYFKQPDILIHLAWKGLPNYKELFHIEENLTENYFFLKNLIVNGLKDVTITGTCFEYGLQEGCLKEDIVTMPANPYALAKDTLRKFMEELKKKHFFHFKWLRLFYVYGEGQNTNSILSQLRKALENKEKTFNMSNGDQLRDYLRVGKAAEYIVKIAVQQQTEGIINCCSGEPISIKALVENYLKQNEQSITLNLGYYPYSDLEAFSFWGSSEKLLRIIHS